MTTTVVAPVRPVSAPRTLAMAGFVSNFDRFAISPILVAVAASVHARLGAVVGLAGGYALAYGVSQPLWGLLSDRIGRVRVIRIALTAAALCGAASALVGSLPVLVVLRVLCGGFFGAVVPSALTYVGDVVAAEHRQRALSDVMAALGLGTGLATLVAGAVAHWLSWRLVFALPALAAVAMVVALRNLPEPERAPSDGMTAQLRAVLTSRTALLLIALGLVEGGVLLGGLTFLAPALERQGLSSAAAGAVSALYGFAVLAFTRVVKALTRTTPAYRLAAVGGAMICLGYLLAAAVRGAWPIAAAAVLFGAAWAFLHSTLQTWATSVVPAARGTAVSCFAGGLFVGSSIGAALGAPPAQSGDYPAVFAVAAAVAVPLTVAATLTGRWLSRRGSR